MNTTDKEFFRIVNYIKNMYGVNLINRRALIELRLSDYLENNSIESYDSLMDMVEADKSMELSFFLIGKLTTNHTFFNRENVHFDYISRIVLPNLIKQCTERKCINVWSAACSSGEEAYNSAMVLRDFFLENQEDWDIKVYASDISLKMLETAIEGIYSKNDVDKLSEDWKKRYFIKLSSGDYKVSDFIKKDVIFKHLNLIGPVNFEEKFDIVLARNVLIYFDSHIIKKVVDKIADLMNVGGYLFVGMTESIEINNEKLEYVQPSIYRRV